MKNAGSIRAFVSVIVVLAMVASTMTILPTGTVGGDTGGGDVVLTGNETIPGELTKTFLEVTDFHAGAPVVYLDQDNVLYITVESTAGSVGDERYISNISQAINGIENLIDENPGNPKVILLQRAVDELNGALDDIADGQRVGSIQPVLKAITFLKAASNGHHGIDTDDIVNSLANSVKDKVGTVIDEAEHNFGSAGPDVESAKLLYDQAIDKLEMEKYAVAMGLLETSLEAVLDAYTCDVNLTVIDIIPKVSETIIDEPGIVSLAAETSETVTVIWKPTQRGIHYVKLNLTGEYEVYASPGSTAESPPSILSVGFPVTQAAEENIFWYGGHTIPDGVTEEFPGINPSWGGRYNSTEIVIPWDDPGNLLIQSGGTLIFNDNVTFVIEQPTTWPNPIYGITINPGAKFIISSPSRTTTIQSSSSAPTYTYPFHRG